MLKARPNREDEQWDQGEEHEARQHRPYPAPTVHPETLPREPAMLESRASDNAVRRADSRLDPGRWRCGAAVSKGLPVGVHFVGLLGR
jgi:hypothetical protein